MIRNKGLTILFFSLLLVMSSVSAIRYDIISNGESWFVCDANGDGINLGDATPVAKDKTFGLPDDYNWCLDLDRFSDIPDTCGEENIRCCEQPQPSDDSCTCYDNTGAEITDFDSSFGSNPNYFFFDDVSSCNSMELDPISSGDVCLGSVITAENDEQCCSGKIVAYDDSSSCVELNLYPLEDNQVCSGNTIVMQSQSCCSIQPQDVSDVLPVNESFICNLQGTSSVWAECCSGSDCKSENNIDYGFSINQLLDKEKYENPVLVTAGTPYVEYIDLKIYDFSGFETLEFNIYFASSIPPSFVRTYNNDGSTTLLTDDITQHMSHGTSAYRFHRVIIPITEFSDSLENVYSIQIGTPNEDDMTIGVYDMNLGGSNSKICGTDVWVDDRDPPSESDISTHHTACERNGVSGVYTFTGTLCCGDDTFQNYGEHYIDRLGACMNGSEIIEGEFVTYQGVEFLYYNQRFHYCGPGSAPSIPGSEDGISLNDNLPVDEIDTYRPVGEHFCGENGWETYDEDNIDLLKRKMILAKLLTDAKGDFTVKCGLPSDVLNGADYKLNNYCILRDTEKVEIGVITTDEVSATTIINKSVKLYWPYTEDNNLYSCNEVPITSDPEEFFTACEPVPSGLSAFFNKEYGILIISGEESQEGLFSFFSALWQAIIAIFTGPETESLPPVNVWDFEQTFVRYTNTENGRYRIVGILEREGSDSIFSVEFQGGWDSQDVDVLTELIPQEFRADAVIDLENKNIIIKNLDNSDDYNMLWNYLTSNLKI